MKVSRLFKRCAMVAIAINFLSFTACDDDDDLNGRLPEYMPSTSISLNTTDATLFIGEELTISALLGPNYATNKEVVWTSTSPDVASVDKGAVVALNQGFAKIIAKTCEVSDTCNITVAGPDLDLSTLNDINLADAAATKSDSVYVKDGSLYVYGAKSFTIDLKRNVMQGDSVKVVFKGNYDVTNVNAITGFRFWLTSDASSGQSNIPVYSTLDGSFEESVVLTATADNCKDLMFKHTRSGTTTMGGLRVDEIDVYYKW